MGAVTWRWALYGKTTISVVLVPELACARMGFFQKEVAEVCSRISTKASEDEKIGMMENILLTWH